MGVKRDVRYAFVLLSFSDGTFIFVSETIENAEAEDEYGYVSRESGRPVARIRRIRLLFLRIAGGYAYPCGRRRVGRTDRGVCHVVAGDHALDGFDDYSADGYRRTYLGRSPETGWEAIVMSWQEGNRTSIHAHPQFAGYFFADGRFLVEIFAPAAAGYARLQRSVVVEAPLGFYAVGAEGSFENHIHRITCLSPTGHSLHVYSDDALRGTVYRETMQ